MTKRWKYFAAFFAAFLVAEGLLLLNMSLTGASVIVYMYHSVSEEPISEETELSVRPSELEKHLKYFCDRGIKTIFADELPELKPGRDRYVVLTFDDGYVDNYTQLFPLLKKYNCKATIFMVAGYTGWDGYLTNDQMIEMTESGLVSIQSHTMFHDLLGQEGSTEEDMNYELGESKRFIENITGREVRALSMPNGSYNPEIMEAAKKYYDVIFTDADFRPYYEGDMTDIHRIGIYRRHTLDDVRRMTDNRGLYIIKRTLQKLVQW